jgi:hypothetical protein
MTALEPRPAWHARDELIDLALGVLCVGRRWSMVASSLAPTDAGAPSTVDESATSTLLALGLLSISEQLVNLIEALAPPTAEPSPARSAIAKAESWWR